MKTITENKLISQNNYYNSIKLQFNQNEILVRGNEQTNFTYRLNGKRLIDSEINLIETTEEFSKKIKLMNSLNVSLVFDKVEHEIFKSNLQTIDYKFDRILAEVILLFYSGKGSTESSVANLINKVTTNNPLRYNLDINSSMYEMIMKKFLTDYALGMRASEVWKRNYQATGGYLIAKKGGEIIYHHFPFSKYLTNFLFQNAKLETPDPNRHKFGNIYEEEGQQKIKLNLQIRFKK